MNYNQLGTTEHGVISVANNQIEELPGPETCRQFGLRQLGKLLPDELLAPEQGQLRLLFGGKCIRLFSFGFLAVMMFTYLSTLGLSPTRIGLLFTFTLLGDAGISLYLTSNADVMGRRKMLLIGGCLSVVTSLLFALSSSYWLLVMAATFGVISPAGNEVGPFQAIELSAIAQLTRESTRTNVLAWYNLFSSFSNAAGALFCGVTLTALSAAMGSSYLSRHPSQPYRIVMLLYALLQCVKLGCFWRLGPEIEVPAGTLAQAKASPVALWMGLHKSKKIVLKLCFLFTLDSFAGSFVLQSIVSHWFLAKFSTPSHTIGATLFFCNLVAGVSALLAARLANAIGLILTMVVTHLPSNILTILVPVMPTQSAAIVMLFARFSISQMDVPTRNAYVVGVVDPDERSAANGLTNVTRSIGAAFGPLCAGLLFSQYGDSCAYPFFIAGSLKVLYDLLLLYNMQHVKPASEMVATDPTASATDDKTSSVEIVTFSALHPIVMTSDDDDGDETNPTTTTKDEDVVEL